MYYLVRARKVTAHLTWEVERGQREGEGKGEGGGRERERERKRQGERERVYSDPLYFCGPLLLSPPEANTN